MSSTIPKFEVAFKPVASQREGSKFLGNAEITVHLSETTSFVIRRCPVFNGSNGKFMKWPNQKYEKDGQPKSFSFIRINEPNQPQTPPFKGAFELAIEAAVMSAVNQDSDGSEGPNEPQGRGRRGGRGRPSPTRSAQRSSASADDEW